ncbi:MAG: carbon-nitrogen hydrolase [Gammaproteobacteria bacterium]
MNTHVTIAAVQLSPVVDRDANLAHALERVRAAAESGATIICLPELFLGHYFCQSEDAREFDRAEAVPGPTTESFEALAKELDVAILVSLFERRAAGLFHNTLAVIDGQRGYVGKYRKMHIPDDPAYYEKFYFAPGDLGFMAFDVAGARVGTLICWDQWFPEAARLTALRGAQILFYPTAIGWHPGEKATLGAAQFAAWQTMQTSHAVANGCFVVAVNRAGFEPALDGGDGIEFWGQSFVAAPDGQILAQAAQGDEQTLIVSLDLQDIDAAREGWPFLRDRRIDSYAQLDQRYLDD